MDDKALQTDRAIAEQMVQLGQWQEARLLLKRLHKAHPRHTDTLLQLALAERFLKHWDEAIALLKKAVALAPHNPLYREQLAMVLMFSNVGRNHRQAIAHFALLLAQRPEEGPVASNLITLALRQDQPQAVLQAIMPLLALPLSDAARLHYASACAIAAYLLRDVAACAQFVAMALGAQHAAVDATGSPIRNDAYFMLIYAEFLRDLLAFDAANPPPPHADAPHAMLHVIGESHCLTPAHRYLRHGTQTVQVQPHLIMGAKAYFFTPEAANSWKDALAEILRAIPGDAMVAVGFGELDCRIDEGIMEQIRRDANYAMEAEIAALCAAYVGFVKRAGRRRGAAFIIGVPAANRAGRALLDDADAARFVAMIRCMNACLRAQADAQQLGFIDLYATTVDGDGWAKPGAHIDAVHLLPSVTMQAIEAALKIA